MKLTCTNKKCQAEDDHKLDLERNVVVCNKCGSDIENISGPIKQTLKDLKQVLTVSYETSPYDIVCLSCKKAGIPLLLKIDKRIHKVICRHCHTVKEHETRFKCEVYLMSGACEIIDAKTVDLSTIKNEQTRKICEAARLDKKKIPHSFAVEETDSDKPVAVVAGKTVELPDNKVTLEAPEASMPVDEPAVDEANLPEIKKPQQKRPSFSKKK